MINDVSGGRFDPDIIEVASKFQVPYVSMHSRGTPETMMNREHLHYGDVVKDITDELTANLKEYRKAGMLE
jgi:dihydropteroate synthase